MLTSPIHPESQHTQDYQQDESPVWQLVNHGLIHLRNGPRKAMILPQKIPIVEHAVNDMAPLHRRRIQACAETAPDVLSAS